MGLKFYNEAKVLYTSLPTTGSEVERQGPFRSYSDGRLGGAFEQLVYIRNDDVANYYTNLSVGYEENIYQDTGEFGETGWGVKYMYGERRPTEAEWDEVASGEPITLPDIGSTLAADTSTYHPIWIRVYCPGNTAAQLRENQLLRVSYLSTNVGS